MMAQQMTETESLERENRRLKSILDDLVKEAENNQNRFNRIRDLELRLLSCESLPKLLKQLTEEFCTQLKVDAISLWLFDPMGTTQELLQDIYPQEQFGNLRFVDQQCELKTAYPEKTRCKIWQQNTHLSQLLFAKGRSIKSFLTLPLSRNEVLIGSYHIGSRELSRFDSSQATDFLAHFAQIIAICIENSIGRDRLSHLSLTDPLTKTRNRRALLHTLQSELKRAQREQKPLSCMFLDIDHFKRINDRYGHTTGDLTLKTLANIIAPNLRATDTLARFGGEEFAVVLPDCTPQIAEGIADRIRKAIESYPMQCVDGKPFNVTTSIGITTMAPDQLTSLSDTTIDQLINCADDAVYHVKNNGRNGCYWRAFAA